MIEQLTFFCITSNQVDAEIRDNGEEDECDDGCHIIIVSENSEILEISEFFDVYC